MIKIHGAARGGGQSSHAKGVPFSVLSPCRLGGHSYGKRNRRFRAQQVTKK